MKTWKNNVTGEIFTESELRKAFEDVKEDLAAGMTFEDWLDEEVRKAKNGQDGLEEVEHEKKFGEEFTI